MLINREHSRLSSQVKTLERVLHAPFSDKEHQRLAQLAANWRSLLAFDDGAPKLADALEVFIAAYQQQSPDQERLHDEVVFQAGVYRMGHWALVRNFASMFTSLSRSNLTQKRTPGKTFPTHRLSSESSSCFSMVSRPVAELAKPSKICLSTEPPSPDAARL